MSSAVALPRFHEKIFQMPVKVQNSTENFSLTEKANSQSVAKILDDFLLSISLIKYIAKIKKFYYKLKK